MTDVKKSLCEQLSELSNKANADNRLNDIKKEITDELLKCANAGNTSMHLPNYPLFPSLNKGNWALVLQWLFKEQLIFNIDPRQLAVELNWGAWALNYHRMKNKTSGIGFDPVLPPKKVKGVLFLNNGSRFTTGEDPIGVYYFDPSAQLAADALFKADELQNASIDKIAIAEKITVLILAHPKIQMFNTVMLGKPTPLTVLINQAIDNANAKLNCVFNH